MQLVFDLYVFDRGQDFRKSFKMIGGLRALSSAPFMALSASAPPDIEAEISLLTLTPLQSSRAIRTQWRSPDFSNGGA